MADDTQCFSKLNVCVICANRNVYKLYTASTCEELKTKQGFKNGYYGKQACSC